MYLKRIDISGFKSFPDPTTVMFDRGITSVVGPNGCGKTNILDSIRWVLGEQRPRLLRGGRMEEVIFSGTRQRPPLNLAQVTLVVDNRSGRLAVPYTEVSIARRLFRSGESEYLINNTPCRLKDISQMLADTGMGSHSYSVIGQGMIDSLLSDNPEDRRFLFEEAAGISKYKTRKKEALNKLNATENDLLRVHDIETEVEKRVRELRVQVYRAKRYQKIADELAEIEWKQLASEYRLSKKEFDEISSEFNKASSALGARTTELSHSEAQMEQARLEMNAADSHAAELSENLNQAVAKAHQAETELVRDRERKEALDNSLSRLTKEIAERTARGEEWTTALAAARKQAEELIVQKDEHAAILQETEERFHREDAALNEIRAARETLATQLRDGERAYGQQQADMAYRTELAQTRGAEKAELTASIEQINNDQREIDNTLAQYQTLKDSLTKETAAVIAELADLENRISVTEETAARLSEQITKLEKELTSCQAQADTLAAIVERGEGLGRGTEAVLKQKEQFPGRIEGWGQCISVPADIHRALEAALSGLIGALWCETPEVAVEVQRFLQEGDVGQACLWDPSLPRGEAAPRPTVDAEGFRGWLYDECHVDEPYRPMAEALLRNVILAEQADQARTIFVEFDGRYAVVALDGTAYVPAGLVFSGNGDTSVVGRTDRLAQLREQIETTTSRLAEHQKEQTSALALLTELKASAEDVRAKKEQLGISLNSLELETGRAQTRKADIDRRLEETAHRMAKVEADLTDAVERRRAAEHSQENWEENHERLVQDLAQANGQLEEQETRHRAALNTLNEKRMAGVELSGRVERMNEEINRKDELLEQNSRTLEDRGREKEQCHTEAQRLTAGISDREKSWTELLVEKDRLSEQRNAALVELDKKKEQFAAHDKTVRGRRKDRDESEAIQHRWEMKRAEITNTIDRLTNRTGERFNKTIEELQATVAELPAELVISEDDIADLKTKLERIGAVNLLALEEYEREKERLDFLQTQVKDLDTAKAALKKTIGELNQTAGERFQATFESARLNFQSVFTDLFQGGEADVRMTDPENPLESPIEIFARPRGKKALGIRHLSGGERALTAIAMLFGLYLVKPSPFCILDEVDAPLDDANTGRFLRLLDRFKSKTQFVIITHNKLTMESADNLYGVTMEQPGVSRLVSVRLNPDQPESEDLFNAPQRTEADVVSSPADQTTP